MNNKTQERAFAKLNLTLDIVGKRPDGYHEMLTVMQGVSLCDSVSLSLNDTGSYTMRTNFGFLPTDDRNIAVKAARIFLAATEHPEMGCDIIMEKKIPVCAGMGGGSSDGAAVLRALNRLFDYPLSYDKLLELAHALGSDVGFCLKGGTQIGRGRGDELEELPEMPDCTFVIVKPAFSIKTPMLFQRSDSIKLREHPDTSGVVAALNEGSLQGICSRLYNSFEAVLPRQYGEIGAIKGLLLDLGAAGSLMTGSGSAVFGIFTNRETAEKARNALSAKYAETALCSPLGILDKI